MLTAKTISAEKVNPQTLKLTPQPQALGWGVIPVMLTPLRQSPRAASQRIANLSRIATCRLTQARKPPKSPPKNPRALTRQRAPTRPTQLYAAFRSSLAAGSFAAACGCSSSRSTSTSGGASMPSRTLSPETRTIVKIIESPSRIRSDTLRESTSMFLAFAMTLR